jgi:hypothetical protein
MNGLPTKLEIWWDYVISERIADLFQEKRTGDRRAPSSLPKSLDNSMCRNGTEIWW